MSDEKKRDRALQRRVRERQEKTGESYQAALQQLTETPTSEPLQPAQRKVSRLLLPFGTAVKVLPGQSAQITASPQILSFWPDRLVDQERRSLGHPSTHDRHRARVHGPRYSKMDPLAAVLRCSHSITGIRSFSARWVSESTLP